MRYFPLPHYVSLFTTDASTIHTAPSIYIQRQIIILSWLPRIRFVLDLKQLKTWIQTSSLSVLLLLYMSFKVKVWGEKHNKLFSFKSQKLSFVNLWVGIDPIWLSGRTTEATSSTKIITFYIKMLLNPDWYTSVIQQSPAHFQQVWGVQTNKQKKILQKSLI